MVLNGTTEVYYTFERDNRELQPTQEQYNTTTNYTFERDNRELQR